MKQEVITLGLDLAKSVFHVYAMGRDGVVLVRRKRQSCRPMFDENQSRDAERRPKGADGKD